VHSFGSNGSLANSELNFVCVLGEWLWGGGICYETVIQRSIEIDQRHGLSERFKAWFSTLMGQGKAIDEKTRASERAQSLATQVDAKTGAQEKAKQAFSVGRGA
jgi:hypothetical protein